MKAGSILDLIGNTPLVQVPHLTPVDNVRLWVKLEGQNPTGSVKDRIALAMVEAGESSGALTKEKIILESTSGNTGIALAMVAKTRGYSFTAVMPDNASAERVQLLKAFGAEIEFSPGAKGTNGSVALAQKLAADDRYFRNSAHTATASGGVATTSHSFAHLMQRRYSPRVLVNFASAPTYPHSGQTSTTGLSHTTKSHLG